MQFIPIKTREMAAPKDDIYNLLDEFLPEVYEKDIILVTSKIVSIHQGRCIKKDTADKQKLIIQEADRYSSDTPKRVVSIVNNAFTLNSGIDPFHEYFVLLPEKPNKIAKEICLYLKKKHKISQLGIIITDSHSVPLRRGVVCYAIGYSGIAPLIELGKKKNYASWATNVVDTLSAIGGIYLGESAQNPQNTPLVIIRGFEKASFTEKNFDHTFFIDEKDDMYGLLYNHFKKNR